MKNISHAPLSGFLRTFIRLYRLLVSPLSPPACRFKPSCSSYALEAIEKRGAFMGIYLTLRRVLRCHPWYKGPAYDPVPGKNEKTP